MLKGGCHAGYLLIAKASVGEMLASELGFISRVRCLEQLPSFPPKSMEKSSQREDPEEQRDPDFFMEQKKIQKLMGSR